jgi:hypothetical protein
MQPGQPGPGQDPHSQNPSDPFAEPGYGQMPTYPDPYAQPQQPTQYPPQYPQPGYGQPGQPYGDPYAGTPQGGQYPGGYPGGAYPGAQYPGAQYPGGGYSVPMMPPTQTAPNNTLGLLAMIFGIVSIPLGVCCGVFGGAGIAGIVLGILGLRKANQGLATNRGMSIAGIVCGAVGLAAGIIITIISAHNGFHITTPNNP